MKKLLALLLLLPTLALAQGGQNKLLTNDEGSVIVGTTSSTGEFRVIHNGTIVLTSAAGGVDLGGSVTVSAIANATSVDVDIASSTVATFDSGGMQTAITGSTTTPSIRLNDGNTGFYGNNGNIYGVVDGSTGFYSIKAGGLVRNGFYGGSTSLPTIHHGLDSNTGLLWPGGDALQMISGSDVVATFDSGGLDLNGSADTYVHYNTGAVTAAGTTISDATQLTNVINIINGGGATNGVKLSANGDATMILIKNN